MVAMKYAIWTTGELRRMKEMHRNATPTMAELAAAFALHPPLSVYYTAQKTLRLRKQGSFQLQRWLKIAHEHFARREAELREVSYRRARRLI